MPVAVVLTVPFAILGALLLTWVVGLENDVYFQVGLVTLVGLTLIIGHKNTVDNPYNGGTIHWLSNGTLTSRKSTHSGSHGPIGGRRSG